MTECYVCGWQVRSARWCDDCGEAFHSGCLQSLDHTCNRDEIDQMCKYTCEQLDELEKKCDGKALEKKNSYLSRR